MLETGALFDAETLRRGEEEKEKSEPENTVEVAIGPLI
jgi:hypothetical protein